MQRCVSTRVSPVKFKVCALLNHISNVHLLLVCFRIGVTAWIFFPHKLNMKCPVSKTVCSKRALLDKKFITLTCTGYWLSIFVCDCLYYLHRALKKGVAAVGIQKNPLSLCLSLFFNLGGWWFNLKIKSIHSSVFKDAHGPGSYSLWLTGVVACTSLWLWV